MHFSFELVAIDQIMLIIFIDIKLYKHEGTKLSMDFDLIFEIYLGKRFLKVWRETEPSE